MQYDNYLLVEDDLHHNYKQFQFLIPVKDHLGYESYERNYQDHIQKYELNFLVFFQTTV